jgi:glycine cleavage system regulatory protein
VNNYLVLTIISDDKPGLVETLAQTISEHGGNWLESRMSHLAGKFAGILQVAVAPEQQESLTEALNALSGRGLKIVVEATRNIDKPASQIFRFSVIGPDRSGIVREIARAFAARHINMDELETDYSSMPWSGEPLFEATGIIEVPEAVNMEELHAQLDTIADELALDIRLETSERQA